ncbi:helicase C-terminal domain-containing protein [Cryptosporangium aurantiacum]|uniref:Helicase conserved C-terminal domain-containing protein n=1 Tax=Cryptosporangium aurantiacum TaxID=134849 RepID=A0A1M7MTF9_9ACTN|nr:helicase C-terminal domain-containing protein [Cryptosporangium aurantiacum]SHM94364.1 Helicase conserved C-terminal domain-containing protein [Cryptosporangium aurantiacum]
MDHLVAHVRGLDRGALAALIAARPDAAAWPEPRSLTELAERLSAVHSAQRALTKVSRAGLQIAEALAALGGVATEARLAAMLDVDDADPDRAVLLRETLRTLNDLALVVPGRDRTLVLAAPLRLLAEPLGLGIRMADVLPQLSVDRIRALAEVWVDDPVRRKSELVDQVVAALADAEAVRAMVGRSREDIRELLYDLAWNGPRISIAGDRARWVYQVGGPVATAESQGLLIQASWDDVELPREIGLALRGPDYRAPFTAPPPLPVSGVVAEADLIAAGTAAATQTLADAERLLDLCDRTPLSTTKAGRVTVRETKRAAKALGSSEDDLSGLLSVTIEAGLLASDEGAVTLTERADAWRDAEPAARLATLLAGWWSGDDDALLRQLLVSYLAALPIGTRVDDVDGMAAVLSWRHPIAVAPTPAEQQTAAARIAVALAEAERFGVVALGAATPLARALVAGAASDPSGLATASAGLVPAPVTTATFQSDLSAVASGVPAAGLAALLDGVATREAGGAASIWRFSSASVRAALDAGVDADTLLANLAAVATGGLPQTLEYLVRDVARRHGHVRVAPAGSVVLADDPALLAELVATKALQALRLWAVAPTVLVSAADPDATLAALRAAGYAPAGLTEGGGARVERRVRRRAIVPTTSPPHSEGLAVDADAVAERLLTATDPPVAAPAPARTESHRPARVVALQADALSAAERTVLVHAIETGAPIRIDYVNATGRGTTRVIENAELSGDAVIAWCRLRDAERMFILSRIQSVSPA